MPVHVVGETDGIPYFAMQRIEGVSLAEALAALAEKPPELLEGRDLHVAITRQLGVEPTAPLPEVFAGTWVQCALRLIRQVTSALDHAHERGILHRDVKPSNILVTPEGRALLFDFGLASGAGTEKLTRTGSHVGSLPYMSPEQLRGEELDARTDVYSLGVTLYEFLCLCLPFEAPTAGKLRDAILAGEPPAVRSRNRAVPRDAETVTLSAMERQRVRRHASAADFGIDLSNVLDLRPIRARRAGAFVRARRWTQRHPTTSVAAALGLALLLVGPSVAAIVARRSERRLRVEMDATAEERRRADPEAERASREAVASEAMLDFVLGLFESSDPYRAGARDPTASEILDAGARDIEEEFADQPEIRALLGLRIGRTQLHLGRPREAAASFRSALVVARPIFGAESSETLDALHGLARSELALGESETAETLLREILASYERTGEVHPADRAQLMDEIAAALISRGEWKRAAELLHEIVDDERLFDALDAHARIAVQRNLAYATAGRHDWESAEECFREAIRLARSSIPGPSLELADALTGLTWLLQGQPERAEEAVELVEETIEIRRALQGERSIELAREIDRLAWFLGKLGRHAEALELFAEAIDRVREELGEGSADEASFLYHYGQELAAAGDPQAEEVLRRAIEIDRELPDRGGAGLAEAALCLGQHLARAGGFRDAGACFEEAIRNQRLVEGGEARLVDALGWLGKMHLELGEPVSAEPLFQECHAIAAEHAGPDSIDAAEASVHVAACRVARGALEDAVPLLSAALPILEAQRGRASPAAQLGIRALVAIYESRGEAERAAEARAKLAPLREE